MPGTLGEITQRTGYPKAQVLRLIILARKDGLRIYARAQPRVLEASAEAGSALTFYTHTEEVKA